MAANNGAPEGGRKGGSRRGGFRPAAQAAAGLTRGAGARRGFAERRVMTDWDAIAGPALARLCRPVRMSFGRGDSGGATLTVAAEGVAALEAQHMAELIAERVNAAYGYRAVARVRVAQTAPGVGAGGVADETTAFMGPPRLDAPPSPDICAVTDPGLRDALARLEANRRRRAERDRRDDQNRSRPG